MASSPDVTTFDSLNRRVLLAVELIDPMSQAIVSRGLEVRASGLAGKPIVSHSGRFVWLEEGSAWPDEIRVEPGRLPYVPHIAAPPARPADLATAPANARHLRIRLRPTIAYPVEEGTTAIRGHLVESASPNASPIPRARVQLAWRDEFGAWLPPPPQPESPGPGTQPSPREQETTADGEFLVFLNLRPAVGPKPDIDDRGYLAVRLQVTQNPAAPVTRVTADDYPFLPPGEDPNGLRKGRVREGRVLARDVRLAWNDLTPV